MKLVICEDEAAQREIIRKSVSAYAEEKRIACSIQEFESAEQLLFSCEGQCDIDIILLDIQMKEMNGVMLAKELRRRNPSLAVIFITALTDRAYIYEGFALQAVNYLIKPFVEEQLFACLDQAIEQCKKQERALLLSVDKELVKLEYSSIIRAESQGHYLKIVSDKGSLRVKKSMRELEEELASERFWKVSRSDLISLDAVKKITSACVVMVNGDNVIIPKGKHREVSEAFMRYHFHGGNKG